MLKIAPAFPTRSSEKYSISCSRLKISVLSSYDQPRSVRKFISASGRKPWSR